MSESVLARVPGEYPDSDGQPMAENDWQLHPMIDAIAALDVYFRHRPDVYVSGDLLITTRKAIRGRGWRRTCSSFSERRNTGG